MTEAELLEHYWNGQEMAIESFLAYITILSGYLVAAFIVGERLSKPQTLIVTTGFIIFTLFAIWGVDLHLKLTQDLHLKLTHPGRQIMA